MPAQDPPTEPDATAPIGAWTGAPPDQRHPRPRARLLGAVALPLWAIGLVAGYLVINGHSFRAGASATAPDHWPADSRLERALDRPTVVMAVHPRCPCTRASVEELARLAARIDGRAQFVLLGFDPGEPGSEWLAGDLWRSANAIPGAHCVRDAGGAEIARFGVETSGQVLVYDRAGALVFRGGITGSRGHAGDNLGQTAVREWVLEGRSGTTSTPVFGCEFGLTGASPAAGEEPGAP